MLNDAQRAAFAAMRAALSPYSRVDYKVLQEFLTDEQYARYQALERRAIDTDRPRYEAAISKHWPSSPSAYADSVKTTVETYRTMSNRLPALERQLTDLLARIKAHNDFLEVAKQDAWNRYRQLSADDQLWFPEPDESADWPPYTLPDKPPFWAVFPNELDPKTKALARLLDELLEG